MAMCTLDRRYEMNAYVGLDVSLRTTSICVVDEKGSTVIEKTVPSDPDVITEFINAHAPTVHRVGLESGPTSIWLWRELAARDLPVICIDARHAKAALSMQINKSDRNDALGLARIMQTGWYRQVQIKSSHSDTIRVLLNSRALLVKMKRDIENQVRGLLKISGLVIGQAKDVAFSERVHLLLLGEPALAEFVQPLMDVRESIGKQLAMLERRVGRLARNNPQTGAFMTVPGIGPVTALAFLAAIDDPTRFSRSRNVGAYLGLTPRRYASGEVD